jgi:hypothetical protein
MKRRLIFTELHGVTCQNTDLFMVTILTGLHQLRLLLYLRSSAACLREIHPHT